MFNLNVGIDISKCLSLDGRAPKKGTRYSFTLDDIKYVQTKAGRFPVKVEATANGHNLHVEVLEIKCLDQDT